MPLFVRDPFGRLMVVNPGLPNRPGNQGGMGRILSEEQLMSTLPDADVVGMVGPGVKPGGEQAIGARRLSLIDVPPPAATFRPLAGASQNNRGNSQIVQLATLAGGPAQTVPSVVETTKNSGDDAEVITVQLGMDLPSQMSDILSPYAGVNIDVVGIIEWGVGNAIFQAEVDWNQGTSFAICASFVRVSARVGAIGAILQPDVTMVLRASLAYGNANTLGNSSPARRTVPVATTLGASVSSPLIPIPVWAMGFTLLDAGGTGGAGAVAPNYTITLSDGVNNTVIYKVVSRGNDARQIEGQFPIPAKSRFLTVTNNLGITMVAPKLLFNLGF